MLRIPLTLLTLAVALAASASAASAASSMQIGMADDRLLLYGSEAEATKAADEWAALGVDSVRIHVVWANYAPEMRSTKMPAGFDPANPNSPGYHWGHLDRAVNLVRSRGMQVLLTVTGWGPYWGSQQPGKRSERWKPDPAKFAKFAEAVARRYGSQVDQYVIWNEPNQPLWLNPQYTCKTKKVGKKNRKVCTPYAPHLYRKIVLKAGAAIRKADPGAKIIVGALAPRGQNATRDASKMRPLTFIREFGCVDGRYKRVRTGQCRGFTAPTVDGFAYHPLGLTVSPTTPSRHPDDAQIADLPRLKRALDGVTRAKGLRVRGGGKIGLWFDEYGYQTNPPDKYAGVSLSRQNTWLQQAAWMAYRDSRVKNLTQYVWEDEPYESKGGGNQGGLRYIDGRAKPALAGFRSPFWAVRRNRTTVALWGQVRPGGATTVTIQRRKGNRWARVTAKRTNRYGGFTHTARIRGKAKFRFIWPGGSSNARTVGAR